MGTRLDPDLWIWKKNREKFWDIKKILDSVAETSEKTQCFSYSENSDELEKTLTKIKKILDEGSIKKWNVPSDNEKLEAIKKEIDYQYDSGLVSHTVLHLNGLVMDIKFIVEQEDP